MVKANNNKVEYTKAQLLAMSTEGKICRIFESYEEARAYVNKEMEDGIETVEQVNESVEVYKSVNKRADAEHTYISVVTTADGEVIYEVVNVFPMATLHVNGRYEPGDETDIKDVENFVYDKELYYNGEIYYYTEAGTVITDVDADKAVDIAEYLIRNDVEHSDEVYDIEEDTELYDAHFWNSRCIDEKDAFVMAFMGMRDVEQDEYEAMVHHGLKIVLVDTFRYWDDEDDYMAGFGGCVMCSKALADVIAEREYRYA